LNLQIGEFGYVRFTADDACVSEAIDEAILELCSHRLLSGVAVIANGRNFTCLHRFAKYRIEISPHLNITYGRPLSSQHEVTTLTDADGAFRAPMEYCRNSDSSPLDAVRRYQNTALGAICTRELLHEFRAQRDFCAKEVPSLSPRSSLHHDIDEVPAVYGALESVWPEFQSRQLELRRNSICGYGYLFARHEESVYGYEQRLIEFIQKAAGASRTSHGGVYEIAVHPAMEKRGYSDFTVYADGRVIEFNALISLVNSRFFCFYDEVKRAWMIPINPSLGDSHA
jgi:predicted glycoside hydrolase/deacetylase ChbG (UPF0249 family)